ncbi:uncharacterized protein LOC109826032 [Asparagus officinalis]|nr:uncharacterized protein LOC109826032 [Asparagus officinalis]
MLAEDNEDIQSTDSSSNSTNAKMLKSRTTSSSTYRTSSSSVPKPSSKPLMSRSLRGEFRKENTKPQVQPNKIPRSKSTSSGTNNSSSSLRKSSVAPLTPIKTTKEQIGRNSRIDQQLDSPTESTSSTRARKKWGIVEKPVLVPDGSGTKGLKRFLHFGKKSREAYRVLGADYDTEVGCGLVSEQTRGLNVDCAFDAYDGFSYSEGMSMPEQVQTPRRRPIPTPAQSKLRKDHLSEISPRSPRSFFSLSTFRNKGIESRLR